MAQGTIVASWRTPEGLVRASVRVAEAGGDVEYIGETALLDDEGRQKPPSRLRQELTASVKAQRDAQLSRPATVPNLGGVVDL